MESLERKIHGALLLIMLLQITVNCKSLEDFGKEGQDARKESDVCEQEENIKLCASVNGLCYRDENSESGFVCKCNKGDVINEDNGKCIDVCKSKETIDICDSKNGICVRDEDSDSGFQCKCKKGDIPNEEDGKCIDVCDLQKNIDYCKKTNEECHRDENEEYGFLCKCKTGEEDDGSGTCTDVCNLQKNIDYCKMTNKECHRDDNEENGFLCKCKKGEEDDGFGTCIGVCKLQQNVDYCKKNNKECHRDDNDESGFLCKCKKGEEDNGSGTCMDICELLENINKCAEFKGTCQKNETEDEGFVCICRKGDKKDRDGKCVEVCERQENINQCTMRNGRCQRDEQENGGFTCICKEGHRKNDDGVCTETCKGDNDCENNATCYRSQCLCLPKTFGTRCENIDCDEISPACEDSGGQCKYDVDQYWPVCECPERKFLNATSRRCEEYCKKNIDCDNGAKCIRSECACLPNTSGQRCENINCSKINPACEDTGGQCQFDVLQYKPVCECPENKLLNESSGECEDPCSINPCLNYGICFVHEEALKCICIGSFYGKRCENEYCTKNIDCDNGAKCIRSECACLPNTSGQRCENINCSKINPACEDTGGQCQFDMLQYKPVCECPEKKFFNESSGKCEDPCTPKPCQNGGTCFLEGDTFRCSCITPFTGDTCDTNPCSGRPCKNGGTCFVEGNIFKCSCVSPFSGYTCETNPCTKRPCQNGGTCSVEGNGFKCSCASQFSGDTCETNTGNMKIVIWILCAIVAVSVVTNGIIICKRYQQRMDERPRNNC